MTEYFELHPDNPQPRLLRQIVAIINEGGLIVYPTDSGYALGCHIGDSQALDAIRRIRQLDKSHNFTLVCRDLSEISLYAKINNNDYRILKAHTPGAYTFILQATREVPKRLQHPKRRTIGIRVPDSAFIQALLAELDQPIMSSSLILPGAEYPLTNPRDIHEQLKHQVDAVIDCGICPENATTVVDLTQHYPEVLRIGAGSTDWLEKM